MTSNEMTIAEILKDPLIGKMMRADGVSVEQLERLLLKAAHAQRSFETHPMTVAMTTGAAAKADNPRRRVHAFPDGRLRLWNPDKT